MHPYAVLWTDHDSQWQPIIAQLRRLLPQLVTFGDYEPEHRSGPAIWLRSVVDWALPEVELAEGVTPIVYLPGVSRQELRAVQECPDSLKPLVELQYRGVLLDAKETVRTGRWKRSSSRRKADWGLDVARDATTRRAMLGALAELATTSVDRLKGRHLQAEDFDKLFSDDPAKDLLLWLSDPVVVSSEWKQRAGGLPSSRAARQTSSSIPTKTANWWARSYWVSGKDPGRRYGNDSPSRLCFTRGCRSSCATQGRQTCSKNSPRPGLRTMRRKRPGLRQALLGLEKSTPVKARERVLELEKVHGLRREWVWAKLGHAPLANALGNIARLVEAAATKLGGASVTEMAKLYADSAWEVDAAALSAAAAVKSTADAHAVSKALNAVYRPWLESAAEHLQVLAEKEPLPGHDGQPLEELLVEPGGMVLFADGLRFDVSQRLTSRMRDKGWTVTLSIRWAGLPTVTATAKPAVSPVSTEIKGAFARRGFSSR